MIVVAIIPGFATCLLIPGYLMYHSKNRKTMKHNLPLSLRIVRGAIGKEFVIKHYKYGVIRTKYPDMTRIVASMEQRKCRDLFKEAVAYAKVIISDPEGKRKWQNRILMRNGVYK